MALVPGTGISSEVAIPYVEIINCCDSSDRGLFNIDGLDFNTFQDGVYNYTGPGFATPQITFVTGNCYTIVNPGNSGTPYFPIPPVQWANFNLTSTDVENGCLDCIDCNPSLTKLVFTSCCNQSVVQTQGQLPFGTTQWIIKYTGPLVNGFDNKCYVVTQVDNISAEEHATLPPAPVNGTYVLVSNDPKAECSDYPVPECPACEDPQCYTVVNCDGVYFNTWEDLSDYIGQFIEIDNRPGSWYVSLNSGSCRNAEISTAVLGLTEPCPCLCYEVVGTLKSLQYVTCDNEIVKDATATKFCSRIFPIFSGTAGQYQILQGEECVDGLCPLVCYKLTNCDTKEVIYSTLQTLSQYVNTSSVVTLLGYEGCWEVDESTATNCDCITVTIEDRSGVNEYTATLITPYNGWNRWTFVIGSDNYFIWNASLNPSTNWTISKDSSGLIPGPTYAESKFSGDCPETISDGSLTGWVIQEVPWINVQTEKCPGPCDCPVDVTILQEFSSCQTCEPIIAYKLQNCEKIYEVQYTTQDLSAYVNQVIETDCGCFTVQQINYVPPSETLIVIDNSFKTCNECLSTYYLLTDCAGEVDDIVTKTNLQAYLGQVIKIENCDTCWEVTTTRNFTEVSNVVVVQDFETCEDCGIPTVCECTKITNLNEVEKTYNYYDCDNVLQSVTLQPGESSDKVCALYWIAAPLFCSCIQFKFKGQSYYAFIVPDQFFNGKPFYTLCTFGDALDCGYVYWDGTDWLITDSDDNITYILTNPTSNSCPYGDWADYNQEVGPIPIEGNPRTRASVDVELTSEQCDLDICTCIILTLDSGESVTFYVVAIDALGYPIYSDGVFTIQFQAKSNCWVYGIETFRDPYYLCGLNLQCPIGNWESESGSSTAVSVECPPVSNEFTVFDHFETFGECKFGNCPQPVFKNNRTVKPGYNTPICTPAKYDEITCRFADILYKIALEKRYGITNCCPDEDDKWLIKKELIDLQALKDPNYNCPDCPCSCNSGKTCSTCNCKN